MFGYSSPLGDFSLYLPPGVSTYRGAYIVTPGFEADTRMIADRRFQGGQFDNHGGDFDAPNFQAYRTRVLALAQEHGLAVMGARLPPDATALDRLDNLLGAMAALATESQHPNLTALFENNRPAGALWALAVEPGAGHTRVLDSNLQFHWMDTVLESRLPATVAPGAPVVLRPVSEGSGWLGDRETAAVAPFHAYDKDKTQASWLPSAQVAADWSAFVSPGRPLACPADSPPNEEM